MKCAICDNPHLTAPLNYASFETHIRIKGAGSEGWLGKKDVTLKPTKARICRSCGHVMLFVGSGDLSRLSELGGVDIAITWTVMRLKQYLSCDERVLALALQRLVEMEGAKIVRFDEMNKSIQVNAPDLGNANKKNSTFNYHTLFEIRDIRQSGLRKLKSLRELSKQSS